MSQVDTGNGHIGVAVAVLAAGASSRMGQHKALLPLAGKPLVAWPVLAAIESRASEILVILGRDADAIQAALPRGRYRALINVDFAQGQGTSLALAVSSVSPEMLGMIVLLADQPFMDRDSVDRVLAAAEREPDRVIMGKVNGFAGHPVYLPRRLFAEIRALTGDKGARDIIARERDAMRVEPLANDIAHLDVDTPDDYLRALGLSYRLDSAAV